MGRYRLLRRVPYQFVTQIVLARAKKRRFRQVYAAILSLAFKLVIPAGMQDKSAWSGFGHAEHGAQPEPQGCGEQSRAMDGNLSIAEGFIFDPFFRALLRIPETDALLSHPQMGPSWEGMVIEEILRQLNALGIAHEYTYYRTGGGAEVDPVVEGNFGRVAVEIKHTSTVNGRDLRALRDFVQQHQARLGVVINNDPLPRLYDDRIIGLPFTHL